MNSILLHQYFFPQSIIIMNQSSCPLCHQTQVNHSNIPYSQPSFTFWLTYFHIINCNFPNTKSIMNILKVINLQLMAPKSKLLKQITPHPVPHQATNPPPSPKGIKKEVRDPPCFNPLWILISSVGLSFTRMNIFPQKTQVFIYTTHFQHNSTLPIIYSKKLQSIESYVFSKFTFKIKHL